MIQTPKIPVGSPICGIAMSDKPFKAMLDAIGAVCLDKNNIAGVPFGELARGFEVRINPLMPPNMGAFLDKDGNVLHIFNLEVTPVEGA